MMDEYISREATVKAFCEKCSGYYDGHCIHRGECDVDVIQTAPAADVQPVKHGKWIYQNNNMWLCSCCKENLIYSETETDREEKQRYCSRCGAKMDR
jgi:hypothetical protein